MTLNTSAIRYAIDKFVSAAGGEVQVPAGKFVIGTLHLKSNVTLRLMPGAVLQGNTSPADYPDQDISSHKKFGTITHDGVFVKVMKALIIADGAENVSIVGFQLHHRVRRRRAEKIKGVSDGINFGLTPLLSLTLAFRRFPDAIAQVDTFRQINAKMLSTTSCGL